MVTYSVLGANADFKEAKEKIVSDTKARYKRQVKVRFVPGSLYDLKYLLDVIHKNRFYKIATIGIEYEAVKKKNSIVWISDILIYAKDYIKY